MRTNALGNVPRPLVLEGFQTAYLPKPWFFARKPFGTPQLPRRLRTNVLGNSRPWFSHVSVRTSLRPSCAKAAPSLRQTCAKPVLGCDRRAPNLRQTPAKTGQRLCQACGKPAPGKMRNQCLGVWGPLRLHTLLSEQARWPIELPCFSWH